MEGGRGFTRSIIEELDSWDIQGDQLDSECGVTRGINDELHSSEIHVD